MNNLDLNNIHIINKTVDYIKIKLLDSSFIYDFLLNKCSLEYSSLSLRNLNFLESSFYNPFSDFYILNMWKIWNTKHRFDIYTFDKIKVWNIIIPLIEYKANIAYLELSWMYFKIYDNLDKDFLNRYDFLFDFFELLLFPLLNIKLILHI